jgi:hypothetical protein
MRPSARSFSLAGMAAFEGASPYSHTWNMHLRAPDCRRRSPRIRLDSGPTASDIQFNYESISITIHGPPARGALEYAIRGECHFDLLHVVCFITVSSNVTALVFHIH